MWLFDLIDIVLILSKNPMCSTCTYAIIDKKTSSCHTLVRDGLVSIEDVVVFVVQTYNIERLFEGMFDDIVVRRIDENNGNADHAPNPNTADVPILKFIADTGMTLQGAQNLEVHRIIAVLDWIF